MSGSEPRLAALAEAVLLPCFDGTAAPEWIRRRVAGSLGGVCLFARNIGQPEQVRAMTASLAAERDTVVIAIDEEAGDVTRLDAATGSRFPGAAALGRVDDVELTARIAGQAGTLLAAVGVSVNFAPCADVALDPANPVIGTRSFGSRPDLVARHTAAWVTGQQAAGVAACAKHFPGHGNTSSDTHRTVAVLHEDLDTLMAQAIAPFRAAMAAGVSSIMVGHLLVPAVDDVPATVSRRWLHDILRDELGFAGATVTDALEMAAIADGYGMAGGAVRALAAGADLLCLGGHTMGPDGVDGMRDAIVAAVVAGVLTEQRLADAAARSATLGVSAVRSASHRVTPPPADVAAATVAAAATAQVFAGWDQASSREAARRALQVSGILPALRGPVLELRCDASANIAVGVIPWGLAAAISGAATEIVLRDGDLPAVGPLERAGSVLVVTRDRHRHPWMVDLVRWVRTRRADAVLVEMGTSGVDTSDAPALASYGATQANSQAVVDRLRGQIGAG